MNNKEEKVYVAIGDNLQDGFKTLTWTLKKWNSRPISIIILHLSNNISQEFVNTPLGKLPATSVSEEKVEALRRNEQEKIDNLFSKYITFCGKVEAEILNVKSDEPVHKFIVDLISELRITNLVMGFTFMKSSYWKPKSAISGSFHVYQNKPEFCNLYIIWGGKQVYLGQENHERTIKDDQGVIVAKFRDKHPIKDWIGKMFRENSSCSSERNSSNSSKSLDPSGPRNPWDDTAQELERYYDQLLCLNLEEEDYVQEENVNFESSTPKELVILDPADSNKSAEGRIECLRTRIDEARETIQLKRNEINVDSEKRLKAEWAISLCNRRVEELEAQIEEEATKNREELKKELDKVKEHINEIIGDVEESKSRLNSLVELQSELSSRLQISTLAKSQAVAQLEKTVKTRAEMVREIEELRRQRAVIQRRIEFCKEKDAIGTVERLSEVKCSLREYSAYEIRLATDDFSETTRLSSWQEDEVIVFRGLFKHSSVAITMLGSRNDLSLEDFQAKVELLSHIRHPHLLAMVGFCSELRCIVFDYMHNGNLMDMLLPSVRNSKKKFRALRWHDRIRIAIEICSGLAFLHMAKPRPIVHGNLSSSKILLDRNLVPKISSLELTQVYDDVDVQSDTQAFGNIVLQLLTGINQSGVDEEAMAMNKAAMVQVLDTMAGQWPLELAEELVQLALRCVSSSDLRIETVMKELDEIRRKTDELVAGGGPVMATDGVNGDVPIHIPRVFICPIFQEVMKNPYVAADGFSYELEAIDEWIKTGHDTSPMTNLRLQHIFLTPNQTLRSLIEEWHNKLSIPFP